MSSSGAGDELAAIDTADNGSPIREMRNDVRVAASQVRYFAGLALMARGETIPVAHDRLDYTLRQPFGVTARIIPFNHPADVRRDEDRRSADRGQHRRS